MQIHIGCICLIFLQCVFANVSSNHMPKRMHSHISCLRKWIFTFVWFFSYFLQFAFSNASSNHLLKRMHSHIGCICLTFLHCEFLNVSSKHLPKKIENSHWLHLFDFFPIFSSLHDKMCHQITCPKGCIVTLAAFVLLSTVCFKCVFKWPAWEDAIWKASPWCVQFWDAF